MKAYSILATVALATLTFSAVSASAETLRIKNGHAVKTVSIDHNDLRDEYRAAQVYVRLEKVAAEVCQVDGDAPAWVLAQDRDCVQRALVGAVADLNSPALSQVHANAGATAQSYARNDR
ncbi:UrcA family protein [Asticcacaulis sp. AC402]|uniref:UrcA family protein n=1 Tax=Asticcacaulis sp. AC402 TaxID=1282361 RepID=UPI0003C3E21F|nr:UrcA family protein [Asticcacaulis sp. AC402]ESQ74640.1 hypothetical protein ABAC402_13425 [Asticcacaulis sp. AC402]